LWLQIKSDVLGIPIRPVLSDAEPLGDAVLAGLGVGLYKDPVETCEKLVKLGETIYPNPETYKIYTKLYNVYRKLYVSVKPLYSELLA
jgi:xylulokinase